GHSYVHGRSLLHEPIAMNSPEDSMLVTTLISAALTVAQPVAAPAPALEASATLSQPGEARRQILDGRAWTCEEDGVCAGRGGGASQPVLRECRRFVARFGPVAAFARDGGALRRGSGASRRSRRTC